MSASNEKGRSIKSSIKEIGILEAVAGGSRGGITREFHEDKLNFVPEKGIPFWLGESLKSDFVYVVLHPAKRHMNPMEILKELKTFALNSSMFHFSKDWNRLQAVDFSKIPGEFERGFRRNFRNCDDIQYTLKSLFSKFFCVFSDRNYAGCLGCRLRAVRKNNGPWSHLPDAFTYSLNAFSLFT